MYWLVLSSYEAQIPPLTCRQAGGGLAQQEQS